MTLRQWLWLLLSATLTGGAVSIGTVFSAMQLSPQTFNTTSDWNVGLLASLAGKAFLLGALVGAVNHIQKSPLSSVRVNALLLLLGSLALLLPACTLKVDVGEGGRYGRAIVGYELPGTLPAGLEELAQ